MEPNDYFNIAHFLANVKQEKISKEIFYRTAINRLYYGVFHLVKILFILSYNFFFKTVS